MINSRRISMVERYLSGRMAPREAQDFRRRLEMDPKLRQLLRDEQEIEDALRRDRESIPMPGSHRFELFLKANAGRMKSNEVIPVGTGNTSRASIQYADQETRQERFVQYLNNNRLLIAAIVVAAIIALIFFLPGDDAVQEHSIVPITNEGSMSAPSVSGTSNSSTVSDRPVTMGSPVRDIILRAAIETALKWKAGVRGLNGFMDVAPFGDSLMAMAKLPSMTLGIGDSVSALGKKPHKAIGQISVHRMTTQDSVDMILKFMEEENRRREPTIEISDSVRMQFKVQD